MKISYDAQRHTKRLTDYLDDDEPEEATS